MKSSAEISERLARQWHQAQMRAERLLSSEAWPLVIPIGKPSAREFSENIRAVQYHVQSWQGVVVGKVEWEPVNYRAGTEPVLIPVRWNLRNPSEWVTATADVTVADEYAQLEGLVASVEEIFRPILVRQRALWLKKDPNEIIATARLAATLSPGSARGRPLRLLAEHGVDTKFFERNGTLLTRLLDERFDGAVTEQGLVNFLDALEENNHWVMLAPLEKGLLPFKRLRITTSELTETALPCSRILVVENEQCIHLLPELPNTVAILGAGMDLQWLQSGQLDNKSIAYWGDMDSWGLLMLSRARRYRPTISPLLMTQALFDTYASDSAVHEPVVAQSASPEGLTDCEAYFYQYLLNQERGRLEQEYLPEHEVENALSAWATQSVKVLKRNNNG
ncbi:MULTISPECIES: Wadjet anti-phage system protein JetD domain-containing protein [Methylomonas]|uniref:Wadjet protein JetD C-terminal domain-containing protein n=2 Tax=Methylomonas TaxID=416 RepID=A0A140E6X1_9GAMM|nr:MULTISPECIES: Wadjet anti-phage system protein JetD domain-containing protein [Methylomonas]AMK79145.1 hypothetical protein JT25_022120 [Methylomonas denitrificans]OAH99652.1 hypothetical protein A1342_07985 [Methylomonas methanica]TCV78175.1 hypothetical protein EDE11_12522 [Methylomonas methanica]